MTILIVEDSPKTRDLIKQTLTNTSSTPAEFIECEDENEAVQLYSKHRPDWVLMDIGLKTGDGIKATHRIVHSHPEAKVVIVTFYDDPEYRKAAQEAGALKYVLKDHLLEIVEIID